MELTAAGIYYKMFKKDDIVNVTITDIGADGEGIGKVDGYTLFIKDAVVGDVVEAKIMKAKKSYAYARLMSILEPSKARVEPRCPVARQCGGCQIQQMSYQAQLSFKERLVKNNLERIGGVSDFEYLPIVGMDDPFNYRNKAQYPVGRDKNGDVIIGFYAGHTHSIIPCMDCAIGAKGNDKILSLIKDFIVEENISTYDEESGKGLVRHVLIRSGFATGQIMVCIVINGNNLPNSDKLVSRLQSIDGMTSISININREKTNVILGNKVVTLFGKPYIEDYIGNILFRISPLSFYQVNPSQTCKLYEKALEFANLSGNETVWDLYCGIGTISLFLAQKAAKVCGVEIIPQAIEDAKQNASLNNITNAQFFVGKAEEVVPRYYESQSDDEMSHPDVIVVDPPRKGCDQVLLETMVKMQPDRIVYVSCDSATLSRDCKFLEENGYKVRKAQAYDQFGHSVHVETVVLLVHQNVDEYIYIDYEPQDSEYLMRCDSFGATYAEIKEWIYSKYGVKIHNAYIAQVKGKMGLEVGECTRQAKAGYKVQKVTAKQEALIIEAFKHYRLV